MQQFLKLLFCIAAVFVSSARAQERQHLEIWVDAREAPRRLLHSELEIGVSPGPLTLLYPRWAIPTYESPVAALNNIVGLRISASGAPLTWARDPVNMFAFHVNVPQQARTLHVSLDVVAPQSRSDWDAATGQLLIVDWQTLFLYPQGASAEDVPVIAHLRLPSEWRAGGAMPVSSAAPDGSLNYARTTLAGLVDAPVIAGRHFTQIPIAGASGPPVFAEIAADGADAAALPPVWRTRLARIVNEAGALFGGYPYREFHFQLALSDQLGNDGLEHRQSSDIRVSTTIFSADANRLAYGYLIPHEYVHSWNGKFAVPAGVLRRDFETPQTTDLLWVYEGLTRYLNWVLAARAGILNPEEAREYVALLGAKVAHRPGREWRSLQDTALSTGMLIEAPDEWESLRRSVDYYDESLFIWLEADTTIRRLTRGRRSLDDFCQAFFGPPRDPPERRSYEFDDVVAALNAVAPYDWRRFLRERLDVTGAGRAPLGGLNASGWNLQYTSQPNAVQRARDQVNGSVEERFSLGILAKIDGSIVDVLLDSPAWRAGLGPGMAITAVDGAQWSPDALQSAIARSKRGLVRLTVRNGVETFNADVANRSGSQYPHLVRVEGDDILARIQRPRTSADVAAGH